MLTQKAVAGVGFSLSAAASITRCAKTLADDGMVLGVRLDDTDRFCLSGRKLVAVSGDYGADGTEYRTLPDTQVRVKSYRASTIAVGPTHFEVHLPDGQTQYYGRDSLGRVDIVSVKPQATTINVTWPLLAAIDGAKNRINYYYGNRLINGVEVERYLDRVLYGSVASSDRQVSFEYEDRPDKSFGYLYGSPREGTRRLKTVTMLVNAEGWKQVRQYKLAYRAANDSGVTGRSKLWQITECGTTSTECLRPTTFEWQLGQDAYQAGHNQFFQVPLNAGVMLITADFDGDGRTDLVYPDTDHWKYVFARKTPINGTRYYDGAFDGAHPGSRGEQATAFVVDFDLDGRPDLLKRDGFPNGHWMGFLTRGSSGQHEVMNTAFSGPLDQSSVPGNGAMFGDFDGDGLQDVLEYKPSLVGAEEDFYIWTWRKRTGKVNLKPQAGGNGVYEDQAFGPVQPVPVVELHQVPGDSVLVFDVDGDGRDEMIKEDFGTGQLVAVDIPTGTKSAPLNLPASVLRLDMKLADVNGDGLVDVLVSSTEDLFRMVVYYENTGRGFRPPVGLLAGQYGFKAARVSSTSIATASATSWCREPAPAIPRRSSAWTCSRRASMRKASRSSRRRRCSTSRRRWRSTTW